MTDQFVNNGGEYELPELVRLINDELTACLRVQSEDTLPVEKKEELEDIGRHICIELAGKQLAIPLSAVLEAGKLQLVQALPLLPSWLTGITNIRGEIVSVVNLTLFLDRTHKSPATERSFLIVHDDRIKVAVTVDRVIGTRALYRRLTGQSKQMTETDLPTDFIAGIAGYKEQDGEKEIHLFDLDGFLLSQKLRDFATA